ncbi:MarR family winged helix-turn-helix transcriptional regulator [Catenuloplanes atrovinosus]|uniref:DNA-binding MarR family transcriptional regulator n=1 Tax=Catenuloplanes atrovinosus TaxID=137266 RepID=A0AAE3YQC4_9ACTN|nr:MarR family transcriptional regulator [Catenuloplanes atrovinosus]MDR7278048.1 DNA-binding MarR family transcriptional regulator [Catenuloplanes atrovinosus]
METELIRLLQEQQRVLRLAKQARPADGVPPGLIGLLAELDRMAGQGCHLKELAAHTYLDPSTVSRAVAHLVSLGYVARTPDPGDRRASVLSVTPAGREVLAETHDWFGTVAAAALAGWTPMEIADFAAMLARFSRDMTTYLSKEDAR